MIEPTRQRQSKRGLAACCALTVVVGVVAAALGYHAYLRQGQVGLAAVGVAAASCWAASLAALVLAGCTLGTRQAVAGILGGTMLRFFPPLLVVLLLQVNGGPLARAGAAWYVVLFFLLTLSVETVLLVWLVRASGGVSGFPKVS